MKKFNFIIGLSLLGIILTVTLILQQSDPAKVNTEPIPKWNIPFKSFVAGTGIVEPSTRNIFVGTPVSGVVEEVYVKAGNTIKKGDLLFKIDDRKLRNQLPYLKAKVEEARSAMIKYKNIYEIDKKLYRESAGGAISKKSFEISRDNYLHSKAVLKTAIAKMKSIEKDIERYTIHSPIDGIVFQCNVTPGTFLEASALTSHFLVIGSNKLNLRVNVDEYNAWRIQPGAKAVAFVRGHPEMRVPLKFLRIEPYIVPKKVMTGLPTERSDVLVLQVIYTFDKPSFSLYVGETMDVFIDTNQSKRVGQR
ncbi:efflux RND transporter periplasmic adaptor subunit [Hydrogenimonas thermophila]|uniref:efflux RND transporter periplasmic adaptor subunit n=1 Tax=Hydrogenimonas thermophila TaxID=223786 RepID=UPI00293716DB|nr:efflux RND transporter periplasmic adaptor subunit [Hydrogenimonas thermophila]WOE69189.1 efflux RND transporter periplasmic adaptor subunit [Hydrogenimonas thermophila]WOE71699.1 efflux RND transporter periplasmic adaptor subunit [Hydrogenimonas thermophila]